MRPKYQIGQIVEFKVHDAKKSYNGIIRTTGKIRDLDFEYYVQVTDPHAPDHLHVLVWEHEILGSVPTTEAKDAITNTDAAQAASNDS